MSTRKHDANWVALCCLNATLRDYGRFGLFILDEGNGRADDSGVTFRWKDYRAKGPERQKVMTLASDEFIRRFLIRVLPSGFHRIRHYGLFANGGRAENLARARELLGVPARQDEPGAADASTDEPPTFLLPCPCCGGRTVIIEIFERGSTTRTRPPSPIRIDTS